MRALVTGCAGFIGSHLTDALLAGGAEVIGIDRSEESGRRPPNGAFELVPIDLSRGDLDEIVAEADVIYHLAAESGVRASWGGRFEHYVRNNLVATQRLLEAARLRPGRRFVYASSSSIYGEAETFPTPESVTPRPLSPYGMTKLCGEHLCRMYGLDTITLRYFTVYGPRQRPDMAFHLFCRAALAGEPITVFGDGRQTRDFTFVEDIVAGTLAAGGADVAPASVYNLGGGSRTSLSEALDIISELAGNGLDVIHVERPPGDMRDTSADITAARRDLGFDPATALRDGLAAQIESLAVPA